MLITPACYSHLLSSLLSLAAGKVAVILEVYIEEYFPLICIYYFIYAI